MSNINALAYFITAELAAAVGRRWYPDLNLIFKFGNDNEVMGRLGANRESRLHDWFVKENNMNVEAVVGGNKVKNKVSEHSQGVKGISGAVRKEVGRQSERGNKGRW